MPFMEKRGSERAQDFGFLSPSQGQACAMTVVWVPSPPAQP